MTDIRSRARSENVQVFGIVPSHGKLRSTVRLYPEWFSMPGQAGNLPYKLGYGRGWHLRGIHPGMDGNFPEDKGF